MTCTGKSPANIHIGTGLIRKISDVVSCVVPAAIVGLGKGLCEGELGLALLLVVSDSAWSRQFGGAI